MEKRFQSESTIYFDKTINSRIEQEISHLGKEKLIVDHIYNLSKKNNKKNKGKIMFLLIKLYRLNEQVNESLVFELKNDRKLLNKRIKTKIERNNVHKDIYKKLLKIANNHFNYVEKHIKNIKAGRKFPREPLQTLMYHKRKAEVIYKELINVKMRATLHKVLLKKLDSVFQTLYNFTVDLADNIAGLVKDIQNSKTNKLNRKTKNIQSIVSDKIGILRNFAYKYSYNVVHSEHFFDLDGNRLVLITKKDHAKI
ncbi:MAG: hypothetical protein IH934_00645 [Nanoarchaeota archaeon]|nr:hypothetical protein [Nanoarchaeota archaeon]